MVQIIQKVRNDQMQEKISEFFQFAAYVDAFISLSTNFQTSNAFKTSDFPMLLNFRTKLWN